MFSASRVAAGVMVLFFMLVSPPRAQDYGPDVIAGSSDAEGAQKVLLQAAQDIRQLRDNPEFAAVLAKAKGVFVVPEMVGAALGFGAFGGTGVLVANQGGVWSNPAFLTIGTFSFGLQFGWQAGPVFIFPMTNEALTDLTKPSQLSFYGAASVTFVIWSSDARFPIGGSEVAVWTGENGGYAGLVVAGADVHDKQIYDKAYYNNKYTAAKQIIASQGDPNANPLLIELQN